MNKAEEWIFQRLHDLELAADGYRFLMRTMTDKDWKGFSKMIDMPGFSKEKFEEDFLLKKINPFVPKDSEMKMENEKKHKVRDMRSLVTMRDQLEDFLDRWEDFFDEIVLSIIQVSNVGNVLNKLGVLRCAKRRDLRQLSDYLRDDDRLYKQQSAEPPSTGESSSQHEAPSPSTENTANQQAPESTADQQAPKKTQGVTKKTNPSKSAEKKLPSGVKRSDTPASLLNPSFDNSQMSMENARSADTPDSGVISDVSDSKTKTLPPKNKKPDDPELWTGRDGRRYRKNKEKAAKLAMEQAKLENLTEESVEKEDSPEPALSGKQKRRIKDKLRKERKSQDLERRNSLIEEMSEGESLVDNGSNSVKADEPEIITPPSLVSIEEKSAQVKKQIANISKAFSGSFSQNNDTVVEKQITKVVKEQVSSVAEKSISKVSVDQIGSIVDKLIDDVVEMQNGTVANSQTEAEQTESVEQKTVAEDRIVTVGNAIASKDPNTQTTGQLSKGQKKRAKKRANKESNKGVYVVNGPNKIHSVELSPGEYQIVKVDRQEPAANVPWQSLARSTELEKAVQEMQKCYISDGASKDGLDKGNWLAYVVEDNESKNTNVGECSSFQDNLDAARTRLELMKKHDASVDYAMGVTALESIDVPELPVLDAETIREILADPNEKEEEAHPNQQVVSDDSDSEVGSLDDLQAFLKHDGSDVLVFRSEAAQLTAALFVRNPMFKEFCQKYSTSKFSNDQAHKLIRRIINDRILYYFEQHKKHNDQEAHRFAHCWTQFKESSPYLLMVMMFLNTVTGNVNFYEFEYLLFPHPNPVYLN